MHLLELAPDLVSLEFDPGEMPVVRQRLARLGRVSEARHASYSVLTVAGEQFLHENEWGDPCLIAQSAAGSALLRFVAVAAEQPDRLAS